jgi:hypothetical protein
MPVTLTHKHSAGLPSVQERYFENEVDAELAQLCSHVFAMLHIANLVIGKADWIDCAKIVEVDVDVGDTSESAKMLNGKNESRTSDRIDILW